MKPPTDFKNVFLGNDWNAISQSILIKTRTDVEKALNKSRLTLDDFMALISPVAIEYLEPMAQKAHRISTQRFGKTIQLYSPLYLSNLCHNICTYCGFSMDNDIPRKTLSMTELEKEAKYLYNKGIRHALLVTGEAPYSVNTEYFLEAIQTVKPYFDNISIEFQPLDEDEYHLLHKAGVYSVMIYQETYHQSVYKTYHPKGKKSNFEYRLDTPDRLGRAGIHKIGLGVLLGLEDWRTDSYMCAWHINYLQKNYWKTKYSVSFPRIRPAEGIIEPNVVVNDQALTQLVLAYRIWNPDLEISISTRESEYFRNHIIPLGVTTMSAESKTNPGGYVVEKSSLQQFETSDERSIDTISELIKFKGYEPVYKDWVGF